jgi:hypothetical protein
MDALTSNQTEVIISQLQNASLTCLQSVYSDFFTALEEYIFSLADAAKSNEKQWQLFALGRAVNQQKSQLAQRMDEAVLDAFVKFRMGTLDRQVPEDDTSTNLSLINNDELERSIAVNAFVQRSEARFMEVLFTLNQRMALLSGGKKLSEEGNPMGPMQLAQSLNCMLEPLNLSTHLLSFSSRTFESLSVKPLKKFYDEANAILIQQGFLPHLKYSISRRQSNPEHSAHCDAIADEQEYENGEADGSAPKDQEPSARSFDKPSARSFDKPSAGHFDKRSASQYDAPKPELGAVSDRQPSAPHYQQDFASQQRLTENILQMQEQVRVAESAGYSDHRHFAHDAVAAGNHSLPTADQRYDGQSVASGDGYASPQQCNFDQAGALRSVDSAYCMNNALDNFDQSDVQTVSLQDVHRMNDVAFEQARMDETSPDKLNAIDLVGKIFEYMLSDDELPDAVKAVLSYLHTPFLKIALTDQDFLKEVNHPAKSLLNQLAETGRSWVNDNGHSQLRIFSKIKETVRRLMLEYSEHPEIVRMLADEMKDFNSKVAKKIAVLEERARSKSEGEEHLRLIKRRVYVEVKQLIAEQTLPAPVLVLVFHPLSDYQTLMGLRYGVDSHEWQQTLAHISYIINSVSSVEINQQGDHYRQSNALKREELSKILKEIAFDSHRSAKLLGFLEQAQNCALEGVAFSVDKVDKDLVVSDEKLVVLEEKSANIQEREVMTYLLSLEFGTWLQFNSASFITQPKLKIAWYNSHSDRFMLSDNSGQYRAMFSVLELAKEKMAGRMTVNIISHKPFFERALEHVLFRLKQSTASVA